jgi:hypothetical protein
LAPPSEDAALGENHNLFDAEHKRDDGGSLYAIREAVLDGPRRHETEGYGAYLDQVHDIR